MHRREAYHPEVSAPYRDLIAHMLKRRAPPLSMVPRGTYTSDDLTEKQSEDLQWWIVKHLCPLRCPGLYWSTGIGLIEAMDTMVEEAISNGNIMPRPAKEKRKPR